MPADVSRTPAVSVCIPLYNKAEFVAETIQSVLDQSFTDFELLVLENASTDRSAEIADTFDDPRIVIVRNSETIPPIDNFNKSVGLSTAPLVKVLAADDLIHPACLEREVSAMTADPTLSMVTCRQHMIDDAGRLLAGDRGLRQRDLVGRQNRATVVRRVVRHGGNPIGNPANVLFRRDAFDAVGGFSRGDDFFTIEVNLWLKLLRQGAYMGLPDTLVSFRLSGGSESKRIGRQVHTKMRQFIDQVCRENSDVVRRRDKALGGLRSPLVRLRLSMLLGAAGHERNIGVRFVRRLLSVDRRIPQLES